MGFGWLGRRECAVLQDGNCPGVLADVEPSLRLEPTKQERSPHGPVPIMERSCKERERRMNGETNTPWKLKLTSR